MNGVFIFQVGTYGTASLQVNSRPPTPGVVSRGIALEGFCSILAGLWGSGTGSTTLTENTHTIDVTKVASRKVVELGAAFLILFSVIGKASALGNKIRNSTQLFIKFLSLSILLFAGWGGSEDVQWFNFGTFEFLSSQNDSYMRFHVLVEPGSLMPVMWIDIYIHVLLSMVKIDCSIIFYILTKTLIPYTWIEV